jgi:hypothetical protein
MDKNLKNTRLPEIKTDLKKMAPKLSTEPKSESKKIEKGSVTIF